MGEFSIKIAGKVIRVKSQFDSTRDYCRQYLSEETPDYCVEVVREELAFEQEAALEEARLEGFRPRIFTDPFLERAAIQRKVAEHLIADGVLLFHGSAVAVDGEGYLFTAKSGTGKSTHTRFWRQVFGDRAVMVNDDKPFLKITQRGVWVCGAPWSGKHGLDTNITVPLKGICLLERGAENRIQRASVQDLWERLLHESYCPLDPARQETVRSLVKTLGEHTLLWRMECTRDPQAAQIAWEAMAGKNS